MITIKEKEDLVKPASNYLRNKAPMNKFSSQSIIVLFLVLATAQMAKAQITIDPALEALDYSSPRTYEIGGITVSGTENLDHSALIAISGLQIGQEIDVPGEKISEAISKLWTQDLFTDIKIAATDVRGDIIFLKIIVEERSRLSKFRFKGVKKGKQESLREDIRLNRGRVITPNLLDKTKTTVRNY